MDVGALTVQEGQYEKKNMLNRVKKGRNIRSDKCAYVMYQTYLKESV